MKRRDLIRHLEQYGCEFLREGGNHSVWLNPENHYQAAIPRHREVSYVMAKQICKELEIELPKGSR